MPSVETALSLVHDANPRFGERAVVFGQGLIGLLVTSILARTTPSPADAGCGSLACTLTTVDAIAARLAASVLMGAHEALLPQEVLSSLPFDLAIEISGNSKALQSAIDSTRNGGRIIVGSWYGNAEVGLKLGIDFHRSQKTLIVSQVSRVG
jgi:threonine dehydrogenase-like Zn-dependent dehydrogenase